MVKHNGLYELSGRFNVIGWRGGSGKSRELTPPATPHYPPERPNACVRHARHVDGKPSTDVCAEPEAPQHEIESVVSVTLLP